MLRAFWSGGQTLHLFPSTFDYQSRVVGQKSPTRLEYYIKYVGAINYSQIFHYFGAAAQENMVFVGSETNAVVLHFLRTIKDVAAVFRIGRYTILKLLIKGHQHKKGVK